MPDYRVAGWKSVARELGEVVFVVGWGEKWIRNLFVLHGRNGKGEAICLPF